MRSYDALYKKRKGLYLVLVVIFALLFTLSVYLLYTPLDLSNYKSLMLPQAEKALHAEIDLKGVVLTILPYPHLVLKDIAVKEAGRIIFTAESVRASLFIMPLLREKRFDIKNLSIEKPAIFVRREADGRLNIVNFLEETTIPITIRKVRIKTGRAYFTDETLSEKPEYKMQNIDALFVPKGLADFSYSGTARLLPSAAIKFSGETSRGVRDFKGNADIKELDVGQGQPYLKTVAPCENLSGNVDISLNYQISDNASSMQGAAAYHNLTASMPALFDKPIISSNGIFHAEVISKQDVFTVSIPKAEMDFNDFSTFGNLKFSSSNLKKVDDGRLVLNLNTGSIPLLSLKKQFFASLLPDAVKQEMDSISFSKGQIKISDFALAGSLHNIKSMDYYKTSGSLTATIAINDAEFSHKDLSRAFSMLDGTVRWKDGNLSLYGISGKYGNSIVEKLDGSIDGILETPFVRLNGYGLADAEEALGELKKRMDKQELNGFAAAGNFPLSFRLSGRLNGQERSKNEGLALAISADLTPIEMVYLPWVKKERGFGAALNAELLTKRNILSIKKARVIFNNVSTFDAKGFLNFQDGLLYQLNIKASDVKIDDIDAIVPYLKKEFTSKGMLSANLDIEKADKTKPVHLKGIASVQDGEFETKLLPKKVSALNLTASFSGNSAAISIDNVKIGASALSGRLDIPDIKTANINFDFYSPYIDYDDFYSRSGEMKETGLSVTGKGKIFAKQAKVTNFILESLQTDVMLKPDAVLLKAVCMNSNGKIVGNFLYSKDTKDAFLWKLSIDASKVELEPFLKQFGAKDKILTGNGDIKLELTAGRGKEMPARRIDGKIEIDSKNGRLWKFVVLSKVFSIVNIISIDELFREGLPYKTVAGNFTIKDGVISTDDFLLDSSSMRMSAIGKIDTADMTVDAKLGLHPFVTVDKIITKIPLAGWIIGGKEKSTVSMYYTIKGPLNNPDVEAIPVQALGEGVWGIFKRTLKLPLDIVEPLMK